MKKTVIHIVFFLFLFLCSGEVFSQGSWVRQNSPTSTFLKKCVFPDSLNGWAMGDSGIIIHTSNGGNDWMIQNSNPGHFFVDIFFLDESYGWALAWQTNFNPGTIIYKTTNGGSNWDFSLYPDTTLFINSIYFTDLNKGYFGTAFPTGQIYRTSNGGAQWVQSGIDSSTFSAFSIKSVNFRNQSTGFSLGGYFDIAGVIWRTTDAGMNWNALSVGPEPINGIVYIDSLNFIAVGGDYEFGPSVVRTTSGGLNWDYQTLNEFGIAYTISLRNSSEAWIPLGFSGKLLYSLDSGNTWIPQNTPDSTFIYYLTFANENNGWAVGDKGAILKYRGQSTSIENNGKTFQPNSINLHQNFPNPFNPSTTIGYKITRLSYVTLKIYDIHGRELQTLVGENKVPGEYNVKFEGENLSSGVYFYKLYVYEKESSENYTLVKKMLLLK